jgi:twinkle protein|tara:strand:+ start:2487 stop:4112 length:1626 start_codon:yes stop_codon:yes gene_type:complete
MEHPRYSKEKFIKHMACDHCGSSDANAEYEHSYYCYSCETYIRKDSDDMNVVDIVKHVQDPTLSDIEGTYVGPLNDRKLSKDTVAHFDVKLAVTNGVVVKHYYPYCTSEGNKIAHKIRNVSEKAFITEGNIKNAVLFGQDKFTSSGKYITICEGEIDTLSVFQMNGSKFPTVGVRSATSAYKDCKKNFEWLDSYDQIVICMDNDEPGKKAAKAIASLFPKKSKIIKLKYKDAGEYLTKDKSQEFSSAWWGAEQYKPDDILSGFTKMWEIAQQPRATAVFEYPWSKVNKLTYGIRSSEFVVITAGSGMGKTQVTREIVHHCLKSTDKNVGVIYLEETAWETAHGVASVECDKPLHLPDVHCTENEKRDAFLKTWGTDRLHTLNDSWRDNSLDYISDKIRYFAKGLDCKLIVLDHISFMVSNQKGDERKMLDEIAHNLKALTVELDICLLAVSHTKRQNTKPLEEGGQTSLSDLRGTAGIGQLANIVVGLERNGQADDERERHTTLLRVLKNRYSGLTGPTSYLHYDQFTGRLSEVEEKEENV